MAIRCSCLRDNDPWRRFCGRCGDPLGPACPGCGFVNTSADKYCGGCGKPVVAKPRAATAAIPRILPKPAEAKREPTPRTSPPNPPPKPTPPPKPKTVQIETMDEVLVISEAPARVDESW